MRETYKEVESYLRTKQPKLASQDQIKAEVIRLFLTGARLKDEEISQLEEKYGGLDKIPPDDLPKITQEHQQRGHRGTCASGRQIIVAATDARKYLDPPYMLPALLLAKRRHASIQRTGK